MDYAHQGLETCLGSFYYRVRWQNLIGLYNSTYTIFLAYSYFKYPEELRRVIYTTNIVEGFHRKVRKYTKTKGAFTSENALLKLIYCACQKILGKWYQPVHNWSLIVSQLQIVFEGRLNLQLR